MHYLVQLSCAASSNIVDVSVVVSGGQTADQTLLCIASNAMLTHQWSFAMETKPHLTFDVRLWLYM